MRTPPVLVALALVAAAAGCGSAGTTTTVTVTAPAPAANGPTSSVATTPALPPITLAAPAEGATVASPVHFAGSAQVFEGTVNVELLAPDRHVLARTFVTASEGAPGRGLFSGAVAAPAGTTGNVVLRVYSQSAADGREQFPVERNLTLR